MAKISKRGLGESLELSPVMPFQVSEAAVSMDALVSLRVFNAINLRTSAVQLSVVGIPGAEIIVVKAFGLVTSATMARYLLDGRVAVNFLGCPPGGLEKLSLSS